MVMNIWQPVGVVVLILTSIGRSAVVQSNHQLSVEEDDGGAVIDAELTEDGLIQIEDTILSPEMMAVMFPLIDKRGNTTRHKRAAVSSYYIWVDGKIPYNFGYLSGSQYAVRAAMDEWQRHTCVKFVPRTNERSYVNIRTKVENGQPVNTCDSQVGFRGGVQYLNLGPNCFSNGIILHELGHVLGLYHEQKHPDRDKHLTINWSNINPKYKHAFEKNIDSWSWGIPYDPTSIMHYESTAFAKPNCPAPCHTMTSKTGFTLGNYQLSSRSDIPIVNKMYCDPSSKILPGSIINRITSSIFGY